MRAPFTSAGKNPDLYLVDPAAVQVAAAILSAAERFGMDALSVSSCFGTST
jgi:hypothetical protein